MASVCHLVYQLQFPCHQCLPAQIYAPTQTRVYTKQDADRFWRIPECYVRGNTIKYLRIPDEVIDLVHDNDFGQSNFVLFCHFRCVQVSACTFAVIDQIIVLLICCPYQDNGDNTIRVVVVVVAAVGVGVDAAEAEVEAMEVEAEEVEAEEVEAGEDEAMEVEAGEDEAAVGVTLRSCY